MNFKVIVVLLVLALIALTQATPCNGTSALEDDNVALDRFKRSKEDVEASSGSKKPTTAPKSSKKSSGKSKKSKKKSSSVA